MGKLIFKMFKASIVITGKILQHSSITYSPIFIIMVLGILFVNWNAHAQARVINLRTLHNLSVLETIPPWLINESIRKATSGDIVVCDSLVVEGNLDLNRAQIDTVHCNLNFRGTEFRGDVKCTGVYFLNSLNFSHATFHKTANFSSAIMQEQATFDHARYESMANFMGTTFKSSATFKNATFNVLAHFQTAEFQDSADFSGSDFRVANFVSAKFLQSVRFNKTEFREMADFIGLRAQGTGNFWKARFHQEARFWNVAFHQGISFAEAEFLDDVAFRNSELRGDIQFDDAQFRRKVTFQDVVFDGKTSFSQVIFRGEAIFKNTKFTSLIQFIQIEGHREIDFTGANFHGRMTIDKSRFYGEVIFVDSIFEGNTAISGEFFALLNLKNALSTKRLDLQKLSFSREEKADITGIILEQAFFLSLKSHWDQLRDWLLFYPEDSEASEPGTGPQELAERKSVSGVYLALQNQYRQSGQQKDLEACYYDFKEYERRAAYRDGDWIGYGSNTLLWLSSGYFTKPSRVVGSGVCVIFFFALLFSQKEAIRNRDRDESAARFGHYFLYGISFSIQAFTHIRYHQPSNNHLKIGTANIPFLTFQRLVFLEGILGWAFFALLLLTVVKF